MAEPLKRIRRGARLEGAAAKNAGPCFGDQFGYANSCSRDSTEQGPAMTTILLPPISIPLAT